MDKKRIVLLGGGYAGVHAAKKLHKKFKKHKDKVSITLIDKNPHHVLMTELHELAGGRVPEESVKISFDRIFSGTMVEAVQDEITDIDFSQRELKSGANSYSYDYLMIATGAEPSDFGIPGIKEHSLPLWGLEDALRIREHVEREVRAATYERDPEKRKQKLTFVVAGGGFTGIEMIGELAEWIPILCEEHKVDPEEVTLMVVEGLGKILNSWPDKPRNKAMKYLHKQGVQVLTNSLIVKAEEGKLTLKDGKEICTDTVIWTCGIKGRSFTEQLPLSNGKLGRKAVDAYMNSPDDERVYLAGDGVWYVAEGEPLPQIVEAAEQTAAVAAKGIAYKVCSELSLPAKKPEPFTPNFHGYMVSIGGRYAVSHTMGRSLSGFPAMALKHLINIYYQHTVCGINGWWRYLKHEIFDVKNNRSFIGGIAAYKLPSYWLAFLRMYLGVMWLIEGVKKIPEWITDTSGSRVYWADDGTGATPWENNGNETAEGVSAGTSATPAEEQAVEAVNGAAPAAEETAAEFAPPLLDEPTALFQWVQDTFVSQAPYLFQLGIVFGEVALGLAFIAGLLTFPAAVASIGLSVMLLMGALASQEILWYIAVSIVMLGGGGRAFGLDYWVMPWLKGKWNATLLAQKSHLYLDEPVKKRKRRKKKSE